VHCAGPELDRTSLQPHSHKSMNNDLPARQHAAEVRAGATSTEYTTEASCRDFAGWRLRSHEEEVCTRCKAFYQRKTLLYMEWFQLYASKSYIRSVI
jgi:hypothetical protein